MKKTLALLAVLGCYSQTSMATTTFTWSGTNLQSNYHLIAEDFGSALSYKPVTPAAALGITGFDVGIEASGTDISKSATALKSLTGIDVGSTMVVPKLYAAKGLPFDIDVAAFYTAIPTTSISVTGFALSYGLLSGGMLEPAITLRAAITNLSGIDEFTFGTKSIDISVSKGFVGITPYIGAGQVWVSSSTTNTTAVAAGIVAESFTQQKVFAGLNINLGLPNFALEYDTTGGTTSYSAKIGLRW